MSAITYPPTNLNLTQSFIGDTLLSPLRFCGRQWNVIAQPLEVKDTRWKAQEVGWKAIASIAMFFATAFAAIPGLIGSLVKAYGAHIDIIEYDVDQMTRNRCIDLGIPNQSVSESVIAGQICAHHNDENNPLSDLFSSLFVSRGIHSFENNPQTSSISLNFQVSEPRLFSFVDHFVNCFKAGASEEAKKASLQKLSDVALSIERPPLNPMHPFEGIIAKNYSKICITFSSNLRKMEVRASA